MQTQAGSIGYQVVHSQYHGDGIQSTKEYQTHETIFSEVPFYFLQSLPNRQNVLICSCCNRFLGSVGIQLKYLQKEVTRQDLSEDGKARDVKEYRFLSPIFPCPFQCGDLYCSEECQQAHWHEKGHCQLCTGQIDENDIDSSALYQLKVFAVQSNEIFLMISDIIAQWIIRNENPALQPKIMNSVDVFNHYVRNIWWEAITIPKNQKKKDFQKILQNLVSDLWDNLNDTFALKEKGYDKIFSKEWIARTIGMFEQNNVGVRLENPVLTFLKELQEDQTPAELLEELYQEVVKVRDAIEDDGECCMEEDDEDDEEGEEEGDGEDEEAEMIDEGNPQAEVDEMEAAGRGAWEALQSLLREEGEETLFPPLDGTAFFILTCKINHSCEPNVRVRYQINPARGLELQMTAIRPIAAQEELLQSYIDQFQPKPERQKALKDYGFTCACSKCASE